MTSIIRAFKAAPPLHQWSGRHHLPPLRRLPSCAQPGSLPCSLFSCAKPVFPLFFVFLCKTRFSQMFSLKYTSPAGAHLPLVSISSIFRERDAILPKTLQVLHTYMLHMSIGLPLVAVLLASLLLNRDAIVYLEKKYRNRLT